MSDPWGTAFDAFSKRGDAVDGSAAAREQRAKKRSKTVGRRHDAPTRRPRTGRTEQLNFRVTKEMMRAIRANTPPGAGGLADLMERALLMIPEIAAMIPKEEGE